MQGHRLVSRKEWLEARQELLAREKAFDRERDALTRERRALPWVRVDEDYVFEGPDGRESLSDLFGRHGQLIVYHFMYHPSWDAGCPSCSLLADGAAGAWNMHTEEPADRLCRALSLSA